MVLGGTLERVTADDLSLTNPDLITPDPLVTQRILTRCAALFPECLGSANYEAVVGLRPKRTPLRWNSTETDTAFPWCIATATAELELRRLGGQL